MTMREIKHTIDLDLPGAVVEVGICGQDAIEWQLRLGVRVVHQSSEGYGSSTLALRDALNAATDDAWLESHGL